MVRVGLTLKVLAVVGIGLCCSFAIAFVSIQKLSQISREAQRVTDKFSPLNKIASQLNSEQVQKILLLGKISRGQNLSDVQSKKLADDFKKEFKEISDDIIQHLDEVVALLKLKTFSRDSIVHEELSSVLNDFQYVRESYTHSLENTGVIFSILDGEIKNRDFLITSVMDQQTYISDVLLSIQTKLQDLTVKSSRLIQLEKQSAVQFVLGFSLVAFFLNLLLAASLAYFSLTKPLSKIIHFWHELQSGKRDAVLDVHSQDEMGELAAVSRNYLDILLLKESMEKEMLESSQRFTDAMNQIPDGFIVHGKNDEIILYNEAFKEIYEPVEDLLSSGTTFENLMQGSLDAGMWDIGELTSNEWMDEQLSQRYGENAQFDTESKLSDGRIILRRETRTATGETIGFHVDVTEGRKRQKELDSYREHLEDLVDERTKIIQQQANKLEEALEYEKNLNEVQKQFIYMASHEFRTPLAIIDSSAQRLLRRKDKLTTEDVERRVTIIRDAILRMTSLMENTLSAAKSNSDIRVTELAPLDLKSLIEHICERQRELSPLHEIRCDELILPETIVANKEALDQVFTNLLSNAVKYSPDHPLIVLKGREVDGFVEISVTDHGIGIDEEDLPSMFKQFFRAKTATRIAGTGLGLHIVKRIVTDHGGDIEVESKTGSGSTFTFRLPIHGPENQMEQGVEKDDLAIEADIRQFVA